jgi:hypothetical protein
MKPNLKKRELANWIRRRLGAPVIDVLIDSSQIDDAIDYAIDYFGTHAGGIGHEKSILVIVPELLKYDVTGTPSQPKPKIGRWRKNPIPYINGNTDVSLQDYQNLSIECLYDSCCDPSKAPPDFNFDVCGTTIPTSSCPTTSAPTTSSPSTGDCEADLDCSTIPPSNSTHPDQRFGGLDRNQFTDFNIHPSCCPKNVRGPGPGWCGDSTQEPHCFTETEKGDPSLIGPFWTEGDTTAPPSLRRGEFVFRSVYDVPKDVVAVVERFPEGRGEYFGTEGFSDAGEALFSPIHLFLTNGGLGMGQGGRFGGGFVDLIGLELGLQYLEMFRTMYVVKMHAQLLDLQHKIRLSPAPMNRGVVSLFVYRKVPAEYMYEHIWVREYAEAMAMIQVGMNVIKYTGATFPGGAAINADFYINEGKEKRQKLEDQMASGMYAEPPDFFMG